MAGLTDQIAAFASKTSWADFGPDVLAAATDHILDSYAVMLAGSGSETAVIARGVFGGGAGPATVAGCRARLDAVAAALANGVAGHALDWDDTQLSTTPEGVYGLLTHPSVPVLAATTAVAEQLGASGQDLMAAYIVGVEVACRIADAISPRHYQAGFHSTGTMAGIGAAAGAGRLLGLAEDRLTTALSIAASMSAGLRENFGTMTKPLHAGRAAQAGVTAAKLAAKGFTASPNGLEGRRGFFSAAGGGYQAGDAGYREDRIAGKLGTPFFLADPGISIKPYPSGSLSHPAQDLILDLVREQDLGPDDIERIEVGTNSNVLNALIHHRPVTGLQGKFSMEYCMATAALRRRAGPAEFTDEAVLDPEVQKFLPRVRVAVDEELEALGLPARPDPAAGSHDRRDGARTNG